MSSGCSGDSADGRQCSLRSAYFVGPEKEALASKDDSWCSIWRRRGSKIRKRLIFPIEENERKEEEELSSDVSEYMKEVNNGKKDSLRTPDCSEDKRNGSGVKLDLLKVRADHLKASQKLTRNVDPQRIKRKLALSSFRWKNCHFDQQPCPRKSAHLKNLWFFDLEAVELRAFKKLCNCTLLLSTSVLRAY